MPNIFAYIIFFSWPLFVRWTLVRYPVHKAIFISLGLSLLILPSGLIVDLPVIPPIDKDTLTYISLFVLLFVRGVRVRLFQPGLITKLIFIYLVAIAISSILNGDPIEAGWNRILPGVTLYDALTFTGLSLIRLLPFFFGRYFATDLNHTKEFYIALVMMALVYTLPMLLEVRLSPQIQDWVYGFSPANFLQQIRDGGYRPMVFYGHGLGLAFWFSTCILALATLYKAKVKVAGFSSAFLLGYFLLVLVLTKTWSAMFYALISIAFILWTTPKVQVKSAYFIAVLVMLYPIGKLYDVIPEKDIIATIQDSDPHRAQSLNFRLENETMLLNHALERPYFGWSGYGRGRVYDETGKDKTIIDGMWIGQLSSYGMVGFFIYYAILILPLYYAKKNIDKIDDPKTKVYFASLAIMLLICIVDSIPNTGMRSIHLFLAGALLGQSEVLAKKKKVNVKGYNALSSGEGR